MLEVRQQPQQQRDVNPVAEAVAVPVASTSSLLWKGDDDADRDPESGLNASALNAAAAEEQETAKPLASRMVDSLFGIDMSFDLSDGDDSDF